MIVPSETGAKLSYGTTISSVGVFILLQSICWASPLQISIQSNQNRDQTQINPKKKNEISRWRSQDLDESIGFFLPDVTRYQIYESGFFIFTAKKIGNEAQIWCLEARNTKQWKLTGSSRTSIKVMWTKKRKEERSIDWSDCNKTWSDWGLQQQIRASRAFRNLQQPQPCKKMRSRLRERERGIRWKARSGDGSLGPSCVYRTWRRKFDVFPLERTECTEKRGASVCAWHNERMNVSVTRDGIYGRPASIIRNGGANVTRGVVARVDVERVWKKN